MSDIVLKSTGFILKFLENLFKDKVRVTGVENIPSNPTLFVCNHFTRAETLILPYFIHKHTGKLARSLADDVVFVGAIGDYLKKTGTLSTDDPNRNEIIMGDLLSGANNWLIYPEGNMMKNKKVSLSNNKYQLHLEDKTRDLYTGSAVMAIKAELLRQNYFDRPSKKIKKKYFISDEFEIRSDSTAIVPVNITYYPIRSGESKIKTLVKKMAKKLPQRFDEEVEIEGKILADSDIHIHFDEPILVKDFISGPKLLKPAKKLLPVEIKDDMIVKYYRHKLTTKFMSQIYSKTTINLDHIFALTLYFYPEDTIHMGELKSRVYVNIKSIQALKKYQMHPSVELDVFRVLIGKKYEPWANVMKLAHEQGILIGDNQVEFLQIDHKKLEDEHKFHEIRRKNMLKVLINDMMLLDDVIDTVKQNDAKPYHDIGKDIFAYLYERDQHIYDELLRKYKDSEGLKTEKVGRPLFLKGENKKLGVVLCHGYKSSPGEVRELAQALHDKGFSVYCVRLDGHGTAPENMKTASWIKWYDSYMRGVLAIEQICDRAVFAGFSTGGLLSLYAAGKHPAKCAGIISINAAVKINDIRFRLVKVVNFWNEFMDKFGEKGKKEFIEDEPEYPETNYSINYVKGIEQLSKLMKKTRIELKNIMAPTLIIQSPDDPIVNPKSGQIIFDDIKSKKKELVKPKVNNHVIIRGNDKEKVFAPIIEFIEELPH